MLKKIKKSTKRNESAHKLQSQGIDHHLLLEAATAGHLDLVKEMITLGADIEFKDSQNKNALHHAIQAGKIAIVRFLLEKGVKLETKDIYGNTPLCYAAYHGHMEIVKLLLEKGAHKDGANLYGNTVLIQAVHGEHVDIVKLLLEKGVNKNLVESAGKTALIIAKDKGHREIFKMLRHFGKVTFQARLEKINDEEDTPNHFLCPISHEVMNDPITVSSGITYDRESLEDYFLSKNNPNTIPCPITKKLIKKEELEFGVNITLQNLIEDYVKVQENNAIRQGQAENPLFQLTKASLSLFRDASDGVENKIPAVSEEKHLKHM